MSEDGFEEEKEPRAENAPPVTEQNETQNSKKPKHPKKTFHIEIFRAWCKSCGICTAFCPRHCIELDDTGSPLVAAPDNCTGCGWCELHCPDFAISVRQENGNGKKEHHEEETG